MTKEELQLEIIASMIEQGFIVTLELNKHAIEALRELGCVVDIIDENLFGIYTCYVYYEENE